MTASAIELQAKIDKIKVELAHADIDLKNAENESDALYDLVHYVQKIQAIVEGREEI